MQKTTITIILMAIAILFSCKTTQKAAKTTTAAPATITAAEPNKAYFTAVKGIIETHCVKCHAGNGIYGGAGNVNLANDENISINAAKIKATVADPASSSNPRMPKGGQLDAASIETIVKWAAKGGKIAD